MVMKSKSRWLIVVFVALIQVATLLLIELGMFGWIRDEANSVMTQKVQEENESLLWHFADRLGNVPEMSDESWLKKAREIASQFHVPDEGFISINAWDSGEMVFPYDWDVDAWRQFVLQPRLKAGIVHHPRREKGTSTTCEELPLSALSPMLCPFLNFKTALICSPFTGITIWS